MQRKELLELHRAIVSMANQLMNVEGEISKELYEYLWDNVNFISADLENIDKEEAEVLKVKVVENYDEEKSEVSTETIYEWQQDRG